MTTYPRSRRVRLDAKALLTAGASHVLALDPAAMGTTVALDDPKPVETRGAVALVSVRGPLAQRAISDLCGYVDGYDAIAARFVAALHDPRVDAIVLVVDSPGGDVAGLEECIRRMSTAREASGKPIAVYVDELAASAAYWMASGVSSLIYGPTSCRVGSIGVIGAVVDETKALEMEGIAVTLIRDPAGKADAHPAQPLLELAKRRVGESVAAHAGRFYDAVAATRKIPTSKVRGLDGAVLGGPAAVSAGLLTGVMSLEGVVEMMRDAADTIASTRRGQTASAALAYGNASRAAYGVPTPTAALPTRTPGWTPEVAASHAAHGLTREDYEAANAGVRAAPLPTAGEWTPELARELAKHGMTRADYEAARAAGAV